MVVVHLLLSIAHASAPACTVDGLGLCSVFDDRTPRLDFPDKTFVPNFKVLASAQNHAALASQRSDFALRDASSSLQNSIDAEALLKQTSPRLSDPVVQYYSNHLTELRIALNGDRLEMALPWPSDGNGSFQKVSLDVIKSQFRSRFSDDLKAKVLTLTRSKRDADRDASARNSTNLTSPAVELINQMRSVSNERLDRVDQLFDFVKATVVAKIAGNRTDAQLSPEEFALVTKLRAVKLNPYRANIDADPTLPGSDSKCVLHIDNEHGKSLFHDFKLS